MSEDKRQDQINKGRQAKTIAEPLQLAGERLKSDLYDTWQICKDRDERDRIWQAFNMVDKVVAALNAMIADGDMAEHQLKIITQRTFSAA